VVAEAVPLLQQQQVAGGDPADDGVLPADRGVVRARDERERVAEQLTDVQVAGVEGQGDQRDVQAARAQPLEQVPRHVLAQVELQLGMGPPQRRQHAGQQVGRDGGDGAEAQRPAERTRRLAGGLGEVGRARQQVARPRHHVLAHRGQPHVAPVALDELDVEQPLQLLDPRRQRRLGDELGLGGGAEVQALGQLHQVGELAKRRQGWRAHRFTRSS
jgi:hypothetical protein